MEAVGDGTVHQTLRHVLLKLNMIILHKNNGATLIKKKKTILFYNKHAFSSVGEWSLSALLKHASSLFESMPFPSDRVAMSILSDVNQRIGEAAQ